MKDKKFKEYSRVYSCITCKEHDWKHDSNTNCNAYIWIKFIIDKDKLFPIATCC